MHIDGTAPYPWPYDDVVDPSSLALVLAGWDDGWRARSLDDDRVAASCAALADVVVAFGGVVLAVQHTGAALLPLATPHTAVGAHGIDGFHGGPLDDLLRRDRRTHLLVAGFGLEGPVHSTLRSANDRGYECLLVTDASAPLTDDLVTGAVSSVTMSGGIFGATGTAASVLSALTPVHAQEIP